MGKVSCEDKRDIIRKLKGTCFDQGEGKHVMYIGDGLNDILCLQESTIGVSINAQSLLNLVASDVVLLNSDLMKVVQTFQILNNGNLFIWICIFWAFSYKIVMLPFAAGKTIFILLSYFPVF